MLIENLTQEEARALGALLEKSLATPDYYPMTLNALRNACNQKSSRDPVSEYSEETLSQALSGLKRKCLVTFVPYGSQGNLYKYRHFLEDVRFDLDQPGLAVLAVLLLRGGQTLNEIRLRASSLHPLETLEAAEAVLAGLANRDEPLAELLPKRPGWKEPRWRDTLREHAETQERETDRASRTEGGESEAMPPRASHSDVIAALQEEVAALKRDYADLKAAVDRIKNDLGG